MKIQDNCVVAIHYTLTNDEGDVIDTSEGRDPLRYLQGHGNIIPGLERALEGLVAGDSGNVVVEPEEGYGPHREELCAVVARSRIPSTINLRQGMKLEVQSSSGTSAQAIVLEVTDSDVTLDLNHPLAGKELLFELELLEIVQSTNQ